jgi:8-amino-7-oxononanoate synthase
MTLEERWQNQLEELRRQGRYRALRRPAGIDFSSNDYLGYGKRFWQNTADLSRSGQASRLLRGHHEIWEEVETQLADWHGSEAALVMSSGYMANEGLLSTVIAPGDWVASDAHNHASIIDGLRLSKAERLIFPHNDDAPWVEGRFDAEANSAPGRQFFLVTESYFGMDADIGCLGAYPFFGNLHTIVDEAHATGCFGPEGSGIVNVMRLRNTVLATVHTGGKALGVPGAYICCSRHLKEYLINKCRHFIFTTALPPIVGQWWLETLAQVRRDQAARDSLHHNAEILRGELRKHGIKAEGRHYIVPIVLGEDAIAMRAADALQEEGYDVRAIRPPTVPAGTARLRISIHADHEPAQLKGLAEALARVVTRE